MPRFLSRLHVSPVRVAGGTVAFLVVVYIGLIAVVMSYAALTVEFAQSVRNNESSVAVLEEKYLAAVARIMAIDYAAANYTLPVTTSFVGERGATALR